MSFREIKRSASTISLFLAPHTRVCLTSTRNVQQLRFTRGDLLLGPRDSTLTAERHGDCRFWKCNCLNDSNRTKLHCHRHGFTKPNGDSGQFSLMEKWHALRVRVKHIRIVARSICILQNFSNTTGWGTTDCPSGLGHPQALVPAPLPTHFAPAAFILRCRQRMFCLSRGVFTKNAIISDGC